MALSHSDFVFPALRNNPIALQKWILSLSFCYSRRWNSRRLENHCYAVWNAILTHLTENQAALLVVPQFVVWFVDEPKHGPDISFRTVAENDAKERTPDFVIAHVTTHPRPSLNLRRLEQFRNLKVHLVDIPVLVESKRIPSRRLKPAAFQHSLESEFHSAQLDLDRQASYLFMSGAYIHQTSVVLVACIGEWWRWKIVEWDAARSVNKLLLVSDDEGELDLQVQVQAEDGCDGDGDGDGDGECEDEVEGQGQGEFEDEDLVEVRSHSDSDEDDELNITSKELQTDGGMVEVVYDDADDAWPKPKEWSLNIRLGTPASNQRFYLLHRYLTQLSQV